MSSNRRVTFADLVAAKLPTKKPETDSDSAPVSELPAASDTAPVHQLAPVHQPAAVSESPQPLPYTGTAPQVAPVPKLPPVRQTGGHTRITHEVSDEILPTLDVYAQSILQRLLRLSWGWSQDTCKVGLPRLAEATNMSESKARRAIRLLISRRFVEIINQDFSNVNQADRGTTYRILLAPASRTAPSHRTAPVRPPAPVQGTPNKESTYKENTQTQEAPAAGVRVGSKFSLEECRKYAKHLQSTGQGINNPGGYATTIHRTGEADELIEKFLAPAPAQVDASQCPDCQG
ncbi:MAG TPA: hypothetical protein VFQ47_06380, partial [Nitrososphaera sp.]|nr:hypothetical protein [Nitrososphaera sp.]